MSSFKRKTYGKVRPVPKPKPKAPLKPSVQELKGIFSRMQKDTAWKTLDYLSEALIWWDKAFGYCDFIYKKKGQSLETAQALVEGKKRLKVGHEHAVNNSAKEKEFVAALQKFARYAAPVLKTPDITPYLKRSKEITKKTAAVNKVLAVKYDKILTLLSQCFKSCPIQLKVVAVIDKGLPRKFDHAIGTMYYSRAHVNEMKRILYRQGLLHLVIVEGAWLSRGMAFLDTNRDGSFIIDYKYQLSAYEQLMLDFEEFSRHPDAPKTLVKREKKSSTKKVYKAGAKALANKKEVINA